MVVSGSRAPVLHHRHRLNPRYDYQFLRLITLLGSNFFFCPINIIQQPPLIIVFLANQVAHHQHQFKPLISVAKSIIHSYGRLLCPHLTVSLLSLNTHEPLPL